MRGACALETETVFDPVSLLLCVVVVLGLLHRCSLVVLVAAASAKERAASGWMGEGGTLVVSASNVASF